MREGFRMVIRTPHEVIFDGRIVSARVNTQSGQVGLRPRMEPTLLVVEPGLSLLTRPTEVSYAATAGGLLRVTRESTTLYTPFAVVGDTAERVMDLLHQATLEPGSELDAHRQLEELELRILRELRQGATAPGLGRARD
jgi:F0F1-type ATP synthase epsilon subunit